MVYKNLRSLYNQTFANCHTKFKIHLLKKPNIKELYLRESREWTDLEIDYISKNLYNLDILDIRNNKKLNLNSLLKLKNLNKLFISKKYKIYERNIIENTNIKTLEFF